jgi:hypothetical protein
MSHYAYIIAVHVAHLNDHMQPGAEPDVHHVARVVANLQAPRCAAGRGRGQLLQA